ncbi:MAG TPA: signal peptidase I [Anaerolineales bacterium]|nr:signal peptidase I [Anaerolineales bacterium]HND48651.1 signal peptidase I [Anaerolineales bacterium]HNE03804.1 signal peptidase I [Anaerolineales bacterium]
MDTLEQEPLVEESKPAEETTNWKRFVLDVIETLVLAVILFVGINSVSARVRVDGFSMQPTLQDGEFVLVSKLSYKFGDFQRGDIIVFDFPMNPDEELVKRIIGVPGDHVMVRDSHVYVNEQMLNENYIAQAPLYSGDWIVPDGTLFVLGDNRNNSNDSKDWGLLPQGNVVGKAVLIYWPPKFWKVLDHPEMAVSQ